VLRNRAPALVETYLALEKLLKTFGNVELVMRDRYVLFRSARIFADVVIMSDAVRLAIHLPRQVAHELFVKVVRDRRQVTHVAKLYEAEQVPALKDFLREAYEFSLS
jgi:predicted transport protein